VKVSDLEIVLARPAAFSGAPSFKLNFLQFLAHVVEPLAEFLSLYSYHGLAVMTAYMSFGTSLEVANQNGILLAAIGTDNVDGFVLEHQQISRTSLWQPPLNLPPQFFPARLGTPRFLPVQGFALYHHWVRSCSRTKDKASGQMNGKD
jgi:hypothetical protein